jgi:LysW-gamma-L-lysine carboxypeptidase
MKLDIRFRDVNSDNILSKIPDNIEFKVLEKTLPYTAEKNTKLTRTFLRAVRAVGGTPVFKKKTGTSDMNILGEKWKTPMLAYGPGDGRLGHTDEENISIEEYSKGIEVLEKVLKYTFK